MATRLLAFYLPQFHRIPENDLWWGKGFTEWTNVTKAMPLFEGHYQPHLPTDFGFYDLRVREARHEQIEVAKAFGIDGFCYHYYWFSGRRLLSAPLEDMLSDAESDMPFCICWANENWTRRWDGLEQQKLIEQQYLPDDDIRFIESLVPYLTDKRYIRYNSKPLLIVYRPQHLPNPMQSAAVWRDFCRRCGIGDIHLVAALTHGNEDYRKFGFDSGLQFPPHNLQVANLAGRFSFHSAFRGNVVDYSEVANFYLNAQPPPSEVFRCVFPSWDNTARRGNQSIVVIGSSPENYEFWLSGAIRTSASASPNKDSLVFINAWNEWAEGCHLEPDRRHGRGFLEATLAAKTGTSTITGFSPATELDSCPVVRRTFISDLYLAARYHTSLLTGQFAARLKKTPRLRRFLRWLHGLFS